MTDCITTHGDLGKRISDLFGGQVRSVTLRFAVNELVTATVEHIVRKETAEGVIVALEKQTWIVDESKCTCHERDSSYVCEYCRSQGRRGHMEQEGQQP